MTTELIQAEVRLFYNGRVDWDTEFFTATCPTDIYNKAKDIAHKRHANHFNCSVATEEEEFRSRPMHRPRGITGSSSMKDQVADIEAATGKTDF